MSADVIGMMGRDKMISNFFREKRRPYLQEGQGLLLFPDADRDLVLLYRLHLFHLQQPYAVENQLDNVRRLLQLLQLVQIVGLEFMFDAVSDRFPRGGYNEAIFEGHR